MDEQWLSVDESVGHLGGSDWVSSKGMPGHCVGRFWKFKLSEVDEWFRSGGASEDSDDQSA